IMHPNDYTVLPIPQLPRTQCLEETAFKQPPLDGTMTVPEMYDWHLEHSPDHPLFAYADENEEEHIISWAEGARAVHRAGHVVRGLAEKNTSRGSSRQLFAILSATDTITYFTLVEGILRAGHMVFPISPRNSAPAVAHLLSKTNVDYVFVGPESSLQSLMASTFKIMEEAGNHLPNQANIPTFEELYPEDSTKDFKPLPPYKPDWKDTAMYMHSSGSTAFPKPIAWSHYRYFMISITPYLGERNMTGKRLACHSMPMYHGMGIMQTGWTATAGLIVSAFKPQSPAVSPTPELVIRGSVATKSDIIFCVPSFVEAWAKNPEHVNMLRQVDGILYGGGPLSQTVGDALSDKGISIFILYGCSECGIMSPILPSTCCFPSKRDWNYFKFPEGIETRFAWDDNGNAEVLLLPGKFLIPCVLNTVVDGIDAYASNDLLSPHPTKPGYWRIYGRADDQIMHNTGEKTNPAPLENMLNQDPHVQAAVMFGRGKFNAGVLIDPRPAYAFDPADEKKLVEFRNMIWPTVEKMNEYAPQHSRIFKEMIMVARPSKPFQYTAKNTARRQAIINDYEQEIEALYAAVAETIQADIAPPTSWTDSSTLGFVRQVVHRVLKHPLGDDDDLFQNGCDSLQATWIRNSLLHALRDTTEVNTRAVPVSFIYQHPNIKGLASYIVQLVNSQHVEVNNEERINNMLNMVQKYSSSFPPHSPTAETPAKDTVLVTGTTGSLGASLLAQLVTSPDIERVYALNRKGSGPLVERQKRALRARGLEENIAESKKVFLLEVSLDAPAMGIPSEILHQIRSSVTHIIHNAWPVNFNMSLESFEPNIKSVRDLIDISLSSPLPHPPPVVFVSSVGVLRHVNLSVPVTESPVEAAVAVGMGYGESKWVAEKLLQEASKATHIKTVSVRLGQVCGDSASAGSWNEAEWFPSLVRSSIHLNAFPTLDKVASWIPVDASARAIIEMRNAPEAILHLAHPRPVPWGTIAEAFTNELNVTSVPYDEWLKLLEDVAAGMDSTIEAQLLDRYPALKIMDFFSQARGSKSLEAMGIPMLDVTKAKRVASSLEVLPQLTGNDARRWIAGWKASGFISSLGTFSVA
ncbi:acetyl-CoA synthetase-like protein, partial [Panus rudis PR-1116 ss-1]